ncbi:DNA adenine methylase [Metabacillus fastidiosus]|uniref:DNA adenine methylase n=1 Tax=Metabacillus fastidiosus TaxID=1458 RepID=UPI002DB99191|nr:DNA adenine methylase [Metabacillus fastidiosus]MEC2074587.1 DNA adenine methylase [Metabacillus fastidiosus]
MGYINVCKEIESFSKRMTGVMIEHQDFRTIIEKYDSEEALFYVDLSYVGREKYYAGGFTEKEHKDLAEMLNNVKGKVIISYYDDQLIQKCYQGGEMESVKAYKQVVGN